MYVSKEELKESGYGTEVYAFSFSIIVTGAGKLVGCNIIPPSFGMIVSSDKKSIHEYNLSVGKNDTWWFVPYKLHTKKLDWHRWNNSHMICLETGLPGSFFYNYNECVVEFRETIREEIDYLKEKFGADDINVKESERILLEILEGEY